MEFHPQECNVQRVSRARSPTQNPYQLEGHLLELQDCSKYLGVDVQSSLSWNNHNNRITKKANSTLGFLRRNLMIASEEAKSATYFSMVRSNLEYCCSDGIPTTKNRLRSQKCPKTSCKVYNPSIQEYIPAV